MKIRHIGITVKDMAKSLSFYRDFLGFTVAREMDESGSFIDDLSGLKDVKVKTIKLNAPTSDGGMIELLCYQSHKTDVCFENITKCGISHFALTVDDVKNLYAKLRLEQIIFNCEPKLSDDGGAIVTFCRDPENNLIELVQEVK